MNNFSKTTLIFFLLAGKGTLESNAFLNHKEQKFVIGYHSAGAGMFSAISGVLNNLAWCEMHGKIPVVYWGPEGWGPYKSPIQTCDAPYYQKDGFNGSTNVWEYYFEPVSDEIYIPGDPVICSYYVPGEMIVPPVSYVQESLQLEKRDHRKRIKQLIDKYVKVKSEVMKKVDAFYEHHIKGKKTIAIHLRGTDKVREIEQVKTEDMCSIALEYASKYPGCQFFVCTDEASLLAKAQELLKGNIITYEAYRSEDGIPIHLDYKHGQHPAKIGEDIIIEALLMSRCDLFVHMCNNVATGVMYFNPELDTVLLLPNREPMPNCVNWHVSERV